MEKGGGSDIAHGGFHVCDGVLCNPAEILGAIFPHGGGGGRGGGCEEEEAEFVEGDAPHGLAAPAPAVAVAVPASAGSPTPMASPIRRGRFLVWPVSLEAPWIGAATAAAASGPGY